MSRVTILGGGGAVGSIATQTLASSSVFSEIVVADINMAAARKLVEKARETMPKARRASERRLLARRLFSTALGLFTNMAPLY